MSNRNTLKRNMNNTYEYKIEPAKKHGSRTVKVSVTSGEYAGKTAYIRTMPDSFSGFFPEAEERKKA